MAMNGGGRRLLIFKLVVATSSLKARRVVVTTFKNKQFVVILYTSADVMIHDETTNVASMKKRTSINTIFSMTGWERNKPGAKQTLLFQNRLLTLVFLIY